MWEQQDSVRGIDCIDLSGNSQVLELLVGFYVKELSSLYFDVSQKEFKIMSIVEHQP